MHRQPPIAGVALNGDDLARFQRKIRLAPSGCWLWTGARTTAGRHGPGGYGRFWLAGREVLAHRAAYETYKGPIPAGWTVDHDPCNRPACVNPAHLVARTLRENILRGHSVFARNARKRRCKRGHWFTPENTGRQKGGRYCRTCRRADWRRYHATHPGK